MENEIDELKRLHAWGYGNADTSLDPQRLKYIVAYLIKLDSRIKKIEKKLNGNL